MKYACLDSEWEMLSGFLILLHIKEKACPLTWLAALSVFPFFRELFR